MTPDNPSEDTESTQSSDERESLFLTTLYVFFAIVGIAGFGLLLATLFLANAQFTYTGQGGWGTGEFGDSFGFVTSVFTGTAYLGLFVAMLHQRKELKLVREERNLAQQTLNLQASLNTATENELTKRTLEDRAFRLIEIVRSGGVINPGNFSDETTIHKTRIRSALNAMERLGEAENQRAAELARRGLRFTNEIMSAYRDSYCWEILAALKAIEKAELTDDLLPILVSATARGNDAIYYAFSMNLKFYDPNHDDLFNRFIHRYQDDDLRDVEASSAHEKASTNSMKYKLLPLPKLKTRTPMPREFVDEEIPEEFLEEYMASLPTSRRRIRL